MIHDHPATMSIDGLVRGCGLRQMRCSRFYWVEPFELRFDWEREDRDTGREVMPNEPQ